MIQGRLWLRDGDSVGSVALTPTPTGRVGAGVGNRWGVHIHDHEEKNSRNSEAMTRKQASFIANAKRILEATIGHSTLEELVAAVWWESARVALLEGALPEYWKLAAKKMRPSGLIESHYVDLIFDSDDFPNKAWADVSESTRNAILKHAIGERSSAVRFLDAHTGYPEAKQFTEWREAFGKRRFDQIGYSKAKTGAPRTFPTSDGGVVVLLKIAPGCGWNHLKDDFLKEVKSLKLPQYGRKNGKDFDVCVTRLRGLAGLVLDQGRVSEKEQLRTIYPNREGKYDYSQLNRAKSIARECVDAMLSDLKDACAPWEEHRKKDSADGAEAIMQRFTERFGKSAKKRVRRKPPN